MDSTTEPDLRESPLSGEEPLAHVTRDGVEYTILGTAHISHKSVETVRRMLGGGDYDAVAVELCSSR